MRQITDMELRVLNASLKLRSMGIDPVVDKVRAEFYAQVTTVKPFWELYDEYLEVKTFKPGTRQKAVVYMKMLKRFCIQSGYTFNIDTWDNLTFGRFIQYLLVNQKYANSSINRLVRGTKSFLRFAYPEKDLSWMTYNQLPIDEEIVALKEGELKTLIMAELDGYLDRTRDLFIFLATTGMRFSDSQRFDPSWITPEEILKFNQLKTVMPQSHQFWLKMNREQHKDKLLHNKSSSKINQSGKPSDRMPIAPIGLVQLSFIHNLI